MILRNAALLLALLPAFVAAQQISQVQSPSADSTQGEMSELILSKPSLASVQAAFEASGLRITRPEFLIAYDADGRPVDVTVIKSSRNRELDRAIVEWAKQIRLRTQTAGMGRLPFHLVQSSFADVLAAAPEIRIDELAYRPSLDTVQARFAETNRPSAFAQVYVDYDAAGRVTDVYMVESSGTLWFDQAILDWAKRIRLKSGTAGNGRLSFELNRP